MKRSVLRGLLVLVGLAAIASAPALAGGEAAGTITGPEMKAHIDYLASDQLEGRGTGTKGEQAAGEYLAKAFARLGLEPAGEDGGFFLPFPVADGGALRPGARLRIERGGFSRDFTIGTDAQAFSFSGSGAVDGPLVFAGYGITDEEKKYDDYAGLDVKGKVVLVLRHEPRHQGGRRQGTRHAFFSTKAENAKKHGAAALLIVTGPVVQRTDELVPFQGAQDDAGLPAMHVRQGLVEGLFRLAGKELAAEQKAIDDAMAPRSFDLGARAALKVEVERKVLTARNVIARLPGADPKLKDEVVVIGAHYDHVGMGGPGALDPRARGQVHNGADDNASGTAGLLEVAQAFAQAAQRPRRTVVFMAFSGEERGLLGSAHWVQHPTLPLSNVVAMVNLDMIGRLRKGSFEVGGVGTSPGFEALVKASTAAEGLEPKLDPSGYGPSDHASFYEAKVPVLFFFTGLHDDYHRPGDDADKIEHEGAAKVARAAFRCAAALADLDARPPYVEVKEGGQDRPRLGVMIDREREKGGVAVERVVDGGPAAAGGLKAGDVIVQLAGRPIDTFADLRAALGGLAFDQEVEVVVMRGAERLTLKVKLTR